MPITPDTKNWTWVLERPCPECGFRAEDHPAVRTGADLRQNVERWPDLLADPRAALRPSDDRWSALEYGCHVRDVFRIYDERLTRMLAEDGPSFENWDQDVTAVEEDYPAQDPTTVAAALVEAGRRLADRFDAVGAGDWERTGHRSDGSDFTVATFATYFLHDPIHHVHDVQAGFAALDGSGPAAGA